MEENENIEYKGKLTEHTVTSKKYVTSDTLISDFEVIDYSPSITSYAKEFEDISNFLTDQVKVTIEDTPGIEIKEFIGGEGFLESLANFDNLITNTWISSISTSVLGKTTVGDLASSSLRSISDILNGNDSNTGTARLSSRNIGGPGNFLKGNLARTKKGDSENKNYTMGSFGENLHKDDLTEIEKGFDTKYVGDTKSSEEEKWKPNNIIKGDRKNISYEKLVRPSEYPTKHSYKVDTGEENLSTSESTSSDTSNYKDQLSYMIDHYLSSVEKINGVDFKDLHSAASAMASTTSPLDGCQWLLLLKDGEDYKCVDFRLKSISLPDNERSSAEAYYGNQVLTLPVNTFTYNPTFTSKFIVDRKAKSLKAVLDAFGYGKTVKDDGSVIYNLNELNNWEPIVYDQALLVLVPGYFFHNAFTLEKAKDEKSDLVRLSTIWTLLSNSKAKDQTRKTYKTEEPKPEEASKYPTYLMNNLRVNSFKMDLSFDSSKKEGYEIDLTMTYQSLSKIENPKNMKNLMGIAETDDTVIDILSANPTKV